MTTFLMMIQKSSLNDKEKPFRQRAGGEHKRKKKWPFGKELREIFWLFFKTWHIQQSAGKAGRNNTGANLAAGSCMNVRRKEEACGQG